MTKVSELVYERVDADQLIQEIGRSAEKAAAAKDAKALVAVRNECFAAVSHFSSMAALAESRFTLNTRDEKYTVEHEY